ncbi:MAG: GntR family transcriptional regulator [Chloroflexi bacterium]|nr:GntR family transcriptional regulator [Chloroflexota bacterium]
MTKERSSFSSYEKHINLLTSTVDSPLSTAYPGADDVLTNDTSSGIRAWRPPRLLLTLLGDYWWQREEQLPSAALVALLTEFGVSDTAARAALSRLVRRGLLVTSKHGRQTFYRLSERAANVFNDGARRIFSFGLHSRSWDGVWSLVAFSIPEENRQLRYVLRDRLRWLGFAPLYDGLWVSPRDSLSDAASQLAELSISTTTLFRAHIVDGTSEAGLPRQAWDLEALRAHYQQFIHDVQPLSLRIKNGTLSPEEALKVRTRIMDVWQGFLAMDPDLPDQILPPDWPRERARQLFIETYDELGPLAQRRVQQIIARYAPDLASNATYHSSSDALLASGPVGQPPPSR